MKKMIVGALIGIAISTIIFLPVGRNIQQNAFNKGVMEDYEERLEMAIKDTTSVVYKHIEQAWDVGCGVPNFIRTNS